MKFLRPIFLAVAVAVPMLLVLFLLNLGIHRLIGPSKTQDAALAKIAGINARPVHGDNAFALLWLMRYDISDDQIEAITADDVRRAHALIASGEDLGGLIPEDRPLLPEPSSSDPGLCETRDAGCLARVQANPAAVRKLLTGYPRTLHRAHMLESRDSYRNEMPITPTTPISNLGYMQRLRQTELALDWQEGRRAEAISGICKNVANWRRLRHGSNSLVFSMIAVAYVDSASRLFADMLVELPFDEPLPVDCTAAFAPIAAEDVSLCTEMVGELQLNADVLGKIGREKDVKPDTFGRRAVFDVGLPLLFDERQTLAWRAQEISEAHCDDEPIQQALDDHEISHKRVAPPMLECAANIIGCILHDLAAPAYLKYPDRLLDNAAHLRLAASLIWLRETRDDARPIALRFATRPAQFRSGERTDGLAEDGQSVWVDNRDQQHGARFSLPLTSPMETPP